MMRLKTALLTFLLILFSIRDLEAGSSIFRVKIVPENPFQGALAKVSFEPASQETVPVSARFLGEDIPVVKEGQGYWCLIGVPLDAESGATPLTLRLRRGNTLDVTTIAINIVRKEYPREFLKVRKKMVEFSKETLKRVLADQRAIREVVSKVSSRPLFQGQFLMPVKGKIKSAFGLRRYFNKRPRSPHSGVDIGVPRGTPVLSTNRGRVALVRDCYLSGKTVIIDHGIGLYSIYAHLDRVLVHEGEMVKRGQRIGLSGMSGRATGPHLHWGISLYNHRVDPLTLLDVFGRFITS